MPEPLDPIEETEDVAEEAVDETAQRIEQLERDVESMRIDLAALRGENHDVNDADVSTGHENPDNEEDDDDPPVFKTSKKTVKERDPYLFERRPIRKHGLFRRLFG